MDRYTVTVDIPLWLIMQRMPSLRPYAPDVWRPIRAFVTAEEAEAYYAEISPALHPWYRIARGTAQQAYAVSVDA